MHKRYYKLRSDAAEPFPRVATVPLFATPEPEVAKGRTFAWTEDDGHITILGSGGFKTHPFVSVTAHPRLASESTDRQEAILRHELGHVVDALYNRAEVRAQLDLPPGWRNWPRDAERYADAIAEGIWHKRILYDAADVQTLTIGTWPRPKGL